MEKCNKCGCDCHKESTCMCECAICNCNSCQPKKDTTVNVTGISLNVKQ